MPPRPVAAENVSDEENIQINLCLPEPCPFLEIYLPDDEPQRPSLPDAVIDEEPLEPIISNKKAPNPDNGQFESELPTRPTIIATNSSDDEKTEQIIPI